jgi:hypothetical protein
MKTHPAKSFLLWYKCPPFNSPEGPVHFDPAHWWKKSREDATHDAALFEVLRRHPVIGQLQRVALAMPDRIEMLLKGLVVYEERENYGLTCVLCGMYPFCLRPWTGLLMGERARFQKSVRLTYPGKGQDMTERVIDRTEAAQVEFHASKGRLILEVDTCFESKEKAKAVLERIAAIVKKHASRRRGVRAHWENWFSRIEDLENRRFKPGDRRKLYRSLIEGIRC